MVLLFSQIMKEIFRLDFYFVGCMVCLCIIIVNSYEINFI